jgi:hypothetical protein
MSWYKKSSINPWSIFDEIVKDDDGNIVIVSVQEERLIEYVSDVTEGSFVVNFVYKPVGYKNAISVSFSLSNEVKEAFYQKAADQLPSGTLSARGKLQEELAKKERVEKIAKIKESIESMGPLLIDKVINGPDESSSISMQIHFVARAKLVNDKQFL